MTTQAPTLTLHQAAFALWEQGKRADVSALLFANHASVMHDPVLLQLLALAQPSRVDARALMAYACYDLSVPFANCWFNLGVMEQEIEAQESAAACYAQCLRLEPQHLGALNNLSDLYRRFGRGTEAQALMERYIQAGGDMTGLEIRLAKIYEDTRQAALSKSWFAKARARAPQDKSAAWEESMCLLREGDWLQGWVGYEARKHIYNHAILGMVSYPYPEWDGKALGQRSLLLHKEQGLGDMIMFASCIHEIEAQPRKLHIAVQSPLARLFTLNFPHAQVWASDSSPQTATHESQHWLHVAGQIDMQAAIGSLGLYRRTKGFGAPKPYLHAKPEEVAEWNTRLNQLAPAHADKKSLRAGLVTTARRDGHGGPGVAEGLPKSLPEGVAGLFAAIEGISWVGLHNGQTAANLAHIPGMDILDTSPWLYDMADTAALIANLDIVVAVDTAVAHLAGAMGKKVYLLLRKGADWRWGRDKRESYWYPDVHIFQQFREGDWWSLGQEVVQALSAWVKTKGCKG
jgi:tetratricopeptide (TPR) repeat protein